MKEFTAADVTRNSGDVFAAAAAEPVAITRHRKPRFVVMSIERYEALTRDSRFHYEPRGLRVVS